MLNASTTASKKDENINLRLFVHKVNPVTSFAHVGNKKISV